MTLQWVLRASWYFNTRSMTRRAAMWRHKLPLKQFRYFQVVAARGCPLRSRCALVESAKAKKKHGSLTRKCVQDREEFVKTRPTAGGQSRSWAAPASHRAPAGGAVETVGCGLCQGGSLGSLPRRLVGRSAWASRPASGSCAPRPGQWSSVELDLARITGLGVSCAWPRGSAQDAQRGGCLALGLGLALSKRLPTVPLAIPRR